MRRRPHVPGWMLVLVVILLILAWLSQQKLVAGGVDRFGPVAAIHVDGR
jgi:hypothetical protein